MKKVLKNSTVFSLLILLLIAFQFSCQKNCTSTTTTTNAISKDSILVQKTWRVDKLQHVISGNYSSYTLGGLNTTGLGYDNMRFKFNSNGTGTHIDVTGTTYPFTWYFTSSDKRSMSISVNGQTFTWEMLEIADNYMHLSAHIVIGSNPNNLETSRLIQIP